MGRVLPWHLRQIQSGSATSRYYCTSCGNTTCIGSIQWSFCNSTTIDSAGIIAQVFEDVKANTWDQELSLLHVDVEPITFHASLPFLELEDIVLQHVCDELQVVTAFTMKADWNLLTVAGSLSFQVQMRGENLLSSHGGMWAVISYTSYQMLVYSPLIRSFFVGVNLKSKKHLWYPSVKLFWKYCTGDQHTRTA